MKLLIRSYVYNEKEIEKIYPCLRDYKLTYEITTSQSDFTDNGYITYTDAFIELESLEKLFELQQKLGLDIIVSDFHGEYPVLNIYDTYIE